MTYLEIIQTSGGVSRVDLASAKVTIGRHPRNHIPLKDELVSRFHCEVERTADGAFVLRDLGSRNGTLVEQQRVAEVRLEPGVVFTVGTTRLRLGGDSGNGDAPPDAPAPPAAPRQRSAEAHRTPGGIVAIGRQAEAIDPGQLIDPEGDPFEQAVEGDAPLMTSRSDFAAASLAALDKVGQDLPYGAMEVELVNARGNVAHAADRANTATAQTIQVLRQLLLACLRTGASDLHLEPKKTTGLVRLRVDGAMVEAATLPSDLARRLMSLIKVLGDIDIAKKALVQEGHFSAQTPDRRVDYRVSFTPAMFGQKLVLRVLDPLNAPQHLRDLNLPQWMYRNIRSVSRQDAGMLLVCGPTGSGKTTTLYSVLRQVDTRQRNVVTIEDPVEYELPGATQIPVDESQGNSFHNLLRSVLRQDPDVLVLGEIRDKETATTAMQAATTGHLVLSTIHAKDTIGTIFRLLDLGVEPYLVASTLNLVLAQRLARVLCPHCRLGRKPTPSQTMRLGRQVEGVSEIFSPGGCERCFGTGYAGRQPIFELLTTTDEIRDVVLKAPNIAALKKAIEMTMFVSLRDHGLDLVAKGLTSMEEIDRVIGIE